MSLTSTFKNLNIGKMFGYSLATGGGALAVFDIFRIATGDLTSIPSLAQSFLSNTGAIAGGIGFAHASDKIAAKKKPANKLIMPNKDLVIA